MSVEVRVTSPSCAWNAVSAVPWIRIDTAGGGANIRALRLHLDENPGRESREGRVDVGGRRVAVVQAGRANPGKGELRGLVDNLRGACPALTWRMDGVAVTTDKTTAFVANSCGRLRDGVQVEVKGDEQGGAFAAKQVRIIE